MLDQGLEQLALKLLSKAIINPRKALHLLKNLSTIAPEKVLVDITAKGAPLGFKIMIAKPLSFKSKIMEAEGTFRKILGQFKVIDLKESSFGLDERLVLNLVLTRKIVNKKALSQFLRNKKIKISPSQKTALWAKLEKAASHLQGLGILRYRKLPKGKGYFFLDHRRLSMNLRAQQQRSKQEPMKVISDFGSCNRDLYKEYCRLLGKPLSQKDVTNFQDQVDAMSSQGLLLNDISSDGYTQAPTPVENMPGVKVQLIGPCPFLAQGNRFDQDILRVLKAQGTFSKESFFKDLANKDRSGEPISAQRAIPHLKEKGWTQEKLDGAFQKRLKRLLALPDKQGLRFHIPNLEHLKTDIMRRLAIPLQKNNPLVPKNPFSLLDWQKDLGLTPKELPFKASTRVNHAQMEFMVHLGHHGVANQATWNQAIEQNLEPAVYRDILANGDCLNFERNYFDMVQTRDRGMGKLVRHQWVKVSTLDHATSQGSHHEKVYTLTQKGAEFLKQCGEHVPSFGEFKKKPNELRHELLAFKLFLNEKRAGFLDGKKLISFKTDGTMEKEHASQMEHLRNQIRKATGFSKAQMCRLRVLQKKKSPLSDQEKAERTRLTQLSQFKYSPRDETTYQRLSKLKSRNLLSDETELQRLSVIRAKVDQTAPGVFNRYAELKRTVFPDLTLVFEEECETTTENEPGTTQSVIHYEVDSGSSRGQSGGYSSKEILNKINNGPQGMIWATPGGLSSPQGQKIQRVLTKAKTVSRIISI